MYTASHDHIPRLQFGQVKFYIAPRFAVVFALVVPEHQRAIGIGAGLFVHGRRILIGIRGLLKDIGVDFDRVAPPGVPQPLFVGCQQDGKLPVLDGLDFQRNLLAVGHGGISHIGRIDGKGRLAVFVQQRDLLLSELLCFQITDGIGQEETVGSIRGLQDEVFFQIGGIENDLQVYVGCDAGVNQAIRHVTDRACRNALCGVSCFAQGEGASGDGVYDLRACRGLFRFQICRDGSIPP